MVLAPCKLGGEEVIFRDTYMIPFLVETINKQDNLNNISRKINEKNSID